MDRLEAFEKMLADICEQQEREKRQLDQLRAAGKEKTATFRQLLANRLTLKSMLDRYREYGLLD